jgi:hypothetical protein
VGDLKPAEIDIDYFMQLATDEPKMAKMGQREWLTQWFAQQFPGADAAKIADVMTRYYALNFIRKPEFMGFNGYSDGINRTAFNPLAWGTNGEPDQNRSRIDEWSKLRADESSIAKALTPQYASAFFELVAYPVEGSAAMNEKFLHTDLTFTDVLAESGSGLGPKKTTEEFIREDADKARAAYDTIQTLTAKYNSLENGKWDGMMSDAPRERHVFEMPRTMDDNTKFTFPAYWMTNETVIGPDAPRTGTGFVEQHHAVSINAAHFARSGNGNLLASWRVLGDLGISGASVVFGEPGRTSPFGPIMTAAPAQGILPIKGGPSPWLEYDFTTTTSGAATLALHLLPTFALDSDHKLRYAVALDGGAPMERDMSGGSSTRGAGAGDGPSGADWAQNVLRNSAIDTIALGVLAPGKHTLRLLYRDPGVVFEHVVITFPGAPPAYPVPPETR